MYKFILLDISSTVTKAFDSISSDSLNTVHFARNPGVGGMPARFIINISLIILIIPPFLSFPRDFMLLFLIITIIKMTELQYSREKIIIVLSLVNILSSIHARLNTEDRAIICLTLVLFICIILPNIALIRINGRIIIFVWNIIRYVGASFCHVIRIVEAFHSVHSTILMNHCWNGDDATFTIRAITVISIIMFTVTLFFVKITLMMNIPDAIDWMMKYFILLSLVFFFLLSLSFMMEQKARVFNSSMIQIDTHEFINKQQILVVIIMVIKIGRAHV